MFQKKEKSFDLTGKTREDFHKNAAFFGKMRAVVSYSDRALNVSNANTIMDNEAPGYNTGDDAPFFTLAWPTGEIGGMGLEGAVRLGFKKQLDSIEDDEERQKLFEKVVGQMYAKGKALNAASQLEFDGVIDPAETRAQLLRGLNTVGPLSSGSRAFIDTW